ncbi:MAG: von Willebrand factor type A domain-containing protein [Oscillospiraceae bacterium]|nr:von Willebrand factor type A domain-containing protein [Oscillospiraceae bacterium]
MKHKINRIAAVAAAAVMLSGSIPAFAAEEKQDIDITYPTPLSNTPLNKEYKAFKNAKPVVKAVDYSDDYYYMHHFAGKTLQWEPVKNALFYYIYIKNPGSSKYIYLDKTFDTSYAIDNKTASYKVRAVSFSYDDKMVLGAMSDPVDVRHMKPKDMPIDFLVGADEEGGAVEYEAADSASSGYKSRTYAVSENSVAYTSASYKGRVTVPYPTPINYNTEEYSHYDEGGFKSASLSPLSTFSADVDTASYANVRRMIKDGSSIPADAVRIEEFINYFGYDFTAPTGGDAMSVTTTLSDCPWNSEAKLLQFGIRTKDLDKEPASNLVFLLDVSGSMKSVEKLPLVVDSINKLTENLSSNDTISIVTYSGEEKVIVTGAKGNMTNTVSTLTSMLEASGSTNGEQGINMAYDIAEKYFIKGANNRVIMATDGDLNVGISDKDELAKFISKKSDSGVYLTILGVGSGNIKDNKMEALAKEGNGNYYYIDCIDEAQKVLADERMTTLVTVADDVKFQVEFNPNTVSKYRLIGYDGRRLANEDFRNDNVTAAEMGAGETITVLYEIIPASGKETGLKYQKTGTQASEYCTFTARYKDKSDNKIKEISKVVEGSQYVKPEKAGISFNVAAASAEFAISLRGSDYAKGASAKHAYSTLAKYKGSLSKVKYSSDLINVIERYLTNEKNTEEE